MIKQTNLYNPAIKHIGIGLMGLGFHFLLLGILGTIYLVYELLGMPFPALSDLFPWIFVCLPPLTLLKPHYLPYMFILFLPLQQILLCISYTHNPEWGQTMKWILGWKDACLMAGLSVLAFRLRDRLWPKAWWQYTILMYTAFMVAMLLRPQFPLMQKIASLRFNIVPFFFLLTGFYLPLSIRQVKSVLKFFWLMVFTVIAFGIFETFFLSEQFFLNHIHIAAFKTATHETGTDPYIGSYLYSPGFMHRRRIVSVFLSATGTGHFLSFALCLLMACNFTRAGLKNRIMYAGFVLSIIIGIFLTTSRLSMFEAFAIGIVFAMISNLNMRLQYMIAGLLILGTVSILYGNTLMKVAALTLSVSDPSTAKHVGSIFTTPLTFWGSGLGAEANVFANKFTYTGGEGIFNRIVFETGLAGFSIFAFTYGVIIFSAFRGSLIAAESDTQRIAKAICITGAVYLPIMIPSVFITVNLFSTVSHGLFWLILGMGFGLLAGEERSWSNVQKF